MNYKEFFIWLDGFMTNRDRTTIKESDIESIVETMKKVKEDDDEIATRILKRRDEFHRTILPSIKVDPLPNAPKIICENDKENNSFQ